MFFSKNGNGNGSNGHNGTERRDLSERQKKNCDLIEVPPEVWEASLNLTKVCDLIIFGESDEKEIVVI